MSRLTAGTWAGNAAGFSAFGKRCTRRFARTKNVLVVNADNSEQRPWIDDRDITPYTAATFNVQRGVYRDVKRFAPNVLVATEDFGGPVRLRDVRRQPWR